MASIATTRTAISDALTAAGFRAFDHSPQNLPPPCIVVGFPTRYAPNDTMSDTASFSIPVTCYVPYSSNRAAEDNLEAMLSTSGTGSVIATIEAIGGNYVVSQVRDFGLLEQDGQPVALGCVVEVDVYA